MSDIINLLPDNIANQIAAGEVIQRPASAVKELLENAIDAGATHIHLLIKDAGKELIKVIDNGKGMSATDARMCFERHATSKIKNINDLFSIRTMGFRGEALASVAAVAQVELKTKLQTEDVGTFISIENSQVTKQEICATAQGTSITIKNLFFNVPARRNFLKSNTTEIRHVVDEFTRVAMAFPEVAFKFTNNETDLFILESGNVKQRILGLLGNNLNKKLVSLEEKTDYINTSGFISTPDAASKTRGNQYFFVNNRFIKSAYLNHAVTNAYQQLIAKDEFPTFVLFLEINPEKIDANVHPTKQEIKFEDEKIVYAFVNSAIKHALSKNSIAPSLDFDLDANISQLSSITQPFTQQNKAQTKDEYLYKTFTQKGQAHFIEKTGSTKNWTSLYKAADQMPSQNSTTTTNYDAPIFNIPTPDRQHSLAIETENIAIQILGKYILYPKQTGFLLINSRAASERIQYENLQKTIYTGSIAIQKCLHPQTISLSPADAVLLNEINEEMLALGFEIEPFGNHTFIIQGTPADVKSGNEKNVVEAILDEYKHSATEVKLDAREKLLRTWAHQKAIQAYRNLNAEEVKQLCIDLFTSSQPKYTPRGEKIFFEMSATEIENRFKNV